MKILNKIIASVFVFSLVLSCVKIEDPVYSFDHLPAPSNVSAIFDVTQDNTGLVSILPSADGAQKFLIQFGDAENETPVEIDPGVTATHTYGEGQYKVIIDALSINGKTTRYEEEIVVSFNPPENLVINIENDLAVSKQVNISATADWTTVFDIYFGDVVEEEPTKVLPDEEVSHQYEMAGDYVIRVIAKGAAIATYDSTFTFTVTEILDPSEAAPTPPNRIASNVISIFSDAYTDVEGTDFNPAWGQNTIASIVDIAGNNTLKYANLNYQGTEFGEIVDASGMEFLHVDVWSMDASSISVFPISVASGEKSVDLDVMPNDWNSYDIPLSDFTSQGLTINDLHQLKITGADGVTVFLDNIYFYKESTALTFPINFETPNVDYTFTNFDGGTVTTVDNPFAGGINPSAKVGKMVKDGGQSWGGAWIAFDDPIDFSTIKTMKMKVYAPKVGTKVLLKVENMDDNTVNYEKEVSTETANAWEELSFDYSGIDDTKSYHKVIIIFDLGTTGDGSADFTYWFDDINLTEEVAQETLSLPLTFESTTLDYGFTDFDGGGTTIMDNPQSGGINTSSKVVQMVKNAGKTWGGSYLTLDDPIDFSTNKTFKMKVFAPKVGTKVLLKVENLDNGSINFEKEVSTTSANAWEELTFDYSSIDVSKSYQKVVIIFDLGTMGDGSADFTYLFDDIILTN
jgi:hypothetical protein